MPEQVRCPSCNAALRVPDNLLGKNVKCPKCQETFIAEAEEPEEPKAAVRDPAPARRSRPAEEPEEEEFLEEEEVEERPRRRRPRRSSGRALEAVGGPAVAMMVSSGLGLFCNIAFIVYRVIVYVTIDKKILATGQYPGLPPQGVGQAKSFVMASVTAAIVGASVGALLCLISLIGAVKMKQLQSFGLALTASIFSLLPLNCCCFIGLPFGIWALVVLNKPEVKDAFR